MTRTYFVDFFNTTVFRKKSAQDVLFDFAVAMGEKFSIEPAAIYNLFIKHQRGLALEKIRKTREAEYRFEEIIERVAEDLFRPYGGEDGGFKECAQQVYFQTELETLVLNEKLVSFLEQEKRGGSHTYLVSQFYCGKEVLAAWLEALGAKDLFDGVYVSCDLQKTKRRGTIYPYLLKELGLNKKEVTMIGDNRHSDYVMARRKGLSAVHLKHKEVHKSKELKKRKKYGANYPELLSLTRRRNGLQLHNFVFPLYLSIKRISAELEERGADNIFFYAREGKFFRRLFEIYRSVTGKCQNVRSHYFLISRNSIMTAALAPIEEEDFRCIVHNSFMSMLSANTFLSSIGFQPEQIADLQRRHKFKFKKTYVRFYATKHYQALLKDPEFIRIYDELRLKRKAGFNAYLKTFPEDFEHGRLFVFDVGWKGLIQDLMQKQLGSGVTMHGFYWGLEDKTKAGMRKKTGLVYSMKKQKYPYNRYFWRYRLLYEQICRADHGHTDAYTVQNGESVVLLDEDRGDKEIFEKMFHPLQDEIAEVFEKICKMDFEKYSHMEFVAMRTYYRMVTHMNRKDMKWQLDAEDCHYDSFIRVGYRLTLIGRWARMLAYRFADCFFALRNLPYRSRAQINYASKKTYKKRREKN